MEGGLLCLKSAQGSSEVCLRNDKVTSIFGTAGELFENGAIRPEEISRILGVEPRSDKTYSFLGEGRESIWIL